MVGIYETNLTEYFDSRVIIGDLGMIQRLNGWADGIAGGLEVFVKRDADIDETGWMIKQAIDFDQNVERVSDHYLAVLNGWDC
ncbi:MAG: hypothetical protein HC859_03875 [Bacteroidia bacterium]|nr:hypothetical protein [Bacteroidia bacterium]